MLPLDERDEHLQVIAHLESILRCWRRVTSLEPIGKGLMISHDPRWSIAHKWKERWERIWKNPLWLHCRILVDSDKFQLNQCQTYFFNYKFQLNKFQLNSCCWYPLIVFETLTSSDSNIQVLGSRLPTPDDPAKVATTTRMPYSAGVMADPCLGFAQE